MSLLDPIPALYRWLALAVAAIALVGFGWLKGAEHGEAKLAKAEASALAEGTRIMAARERITTRVETKYVQLAARQSVITETHIREVPVYVPASDPPLSGGFRLYHDAAALGLQLPDPAGISDAAPVPAQDVARVVAENYGQCRADQLRLQALQEWTKSQGALK